MSIQFAFYLSVSTVIFTGLLLYFLRNSDSYLLVVSKISNSADYFLSANVWNQWIFTESSKLFQMIPCTFKFEWLLLYFRMCIFLKQHFKKPFFPSWVHVSLKLLFSSYRFANDTGNYLYELLVCIADRYRCCCWNGGEFTSFFLD